MYVADRTQTGEWEVVKVEPGSQHVAWRDQLPDPIDAVVAGPEHVWALSETAGTVTELDAAREGPSVGTIPVGTGQSELALNGFVWVLNEGTGELLAPYSSRNGPIGCSQSLWPARS